MHRKLFIKGTSLSFTLFLFVAANGQRLFTLGGDTLEPLQSVQLAAPKGSRVGVADGKGKTYFSAISSGVVQFKTGGALSKQTIRIYGPLHQRIDSLHFILTAQTAVDDGGQYKDLFACFAPACTSTAPRALSRTSPGKAFHVIISSLGFWIITTH